MLTLGQNNNHQATANNLTQNGGSGNQQAGRDIINFNFVSNPDFDIYSFSELIDEMYEVFIKKQEVESLDFRRIDLEEKNKINELEVYFDEIMKDDIVYFYPLKEFIDDNNDDEFREKFQFVLKSIKKLTLEDGDKKLTPIKINRIIKNIYPQKWQIQKNNNAQIFVHYLYFACLIGDKNARS
ncbi:hypothetical protein IO418_001267 [Campylobacter lari]|nr:hypothetical protein [Campylobacter lari]EGK8092754.1 hypothetical protein [Campylobacter lari]